MKAVILWLVVALALLSVFACVSAPTEAAGVKTQLCMVVDGSGTIDGTAWSTIKNAIAKAVRDTIPHDGSVELTIVQFGYPSTSGYARTEIPPTIIDSVNYGSVTDQVASMSKGGGSTPMAHGIFLGWKEIANSNYLSTSRQIINLATDGEPNERNYNATSDLDGSGGSPDSRDDVIAAVNYATSQGLDELDMEGIGINVENRDWFRNWVVYPQPGIIAPPFSKPGWLRVVANADEFASTIGEKLQVVLGQGDVWMPSAGSAFVASILTVGLTSVISTLASAVSNPETFPSQMLAQKISDLFPETLKKWLAEFVSSKRKLVIGQRAGSAFRLTATEIISYSISLAILTLAFSYARAGTLDQILPLLPIVLATSIIVEFVKNFAVEVVARSRGVWTEHRLWYFGLATFLFSTFIFRVPFSSPSRLAHHSPKFTKRSLGLVSSAPIFVALAFAAIFYGLFARGFTLIGNMGLLMCLTMAFFDSIPIPPMNGKDIYDWSKVLWILLFMTTFGLYMLCLLLL